MKYLGGAQHVNYCNIMNSKCKHDLFICLHRDHLMCQCVHACIINVTGFGSLWIIIMIIVSEVEKDTQSHRK